MAIIDPQGLQQGDRLSSCSDFARLYWPWFYAMSNSFGRIELNPKKLRDIFASFNQPPSLEQIAFWFKEYEDNYLLFLYQGEDGSLWGQWATPENMLPRHKSAKCKRQPAPDPEAFAAWKLEYAEKKRTQMSPADNFRALMSRAGESQTLPSESAHNYAELGTSAQTCESLRNVSQDSADLRKVSRGVGVGVGGGDGVGVGKNKTKIKTPVETKPAKAPEVMSADADGRYGEFVEALDRYWKHKNPTLPLVFGNPDGKNLKTLLKNYPAMTLDDFKRCLNHRAKSPVNPSQQIAEWICTVQEYLAGPLDRFGKPIEAPPAPAGESAEDIEGKRLARLAAARELANTRQQQPAGVTAGCAQ